MPRLFQFPLTAKLIHGKNIICGWKRWIIRLSRLAVFWLWLVQVRRWTAAQLLPIMRLKLKSGGCLVIMCSPDFRYLIRRILLRCRVIKWLPDFLISCRIFWNSIFPELTTILPTILWKACCVRWSTVPGSLCKALKIMKREAILCGSLHGPWILW